MPEIGASSECRNSAEYIGVCRMPTERPEVVALVLMAVAQGLGSLAIDTDTEREHMFTEAGTANRSVFLESEASMLSARADLLRAEYDRSAAAADLARLTGRR